MNPVNLGNSVAELQWENENEGRFHPFESDQTVEFDRSVVVDLSVMVPYSESLPKVRMTSMHVGPGLVSASFSDGTNAMVCSVPMASFEPYRPYTMRAVSGACGGMCTFGDVDPSSPVNAKFGDDGPAVLESVVSRIHVGELKRFVDDASGESVTGDVVIEFPTDATVDVGYTSEESGYQYIRVGPSQALDDQIVSPCDSSDGELRAGETSPIRSINGVFPDANGRIALVFS